MTQFVILIYFLSMCCQVMSKSCLSLVDVFSISRLGLVYVYFLYTSFLYIVYVLSMCCHVLSMYVLRCLCVVCLFYVLSYIIFLCVVYVYRTLLSYVYNIRGNFSPPPAPADGTNSFIYSIYVHIYSYFNTPHHKNDKATPLYITHKKVAKVAFFGHDQHGSCKPFFWLL
jgi:hypothetical protein